MLLFNLNPLANALVYAYQSRYVQRITATRSQVVVARREGAQDGSFHVDIGETSVREYVVHSPDSITTDSEADRLESSLEGSMDAEDLMFSCFEMPGSFAISGEPLDAEEPSRA